jgi:hypothetical protein
LGKICCDQSFPLLIGGDFNLIISAADKNKNFIRNKWSGVFNQIINSYELREINMSGGQFTWSNRKEVSYFGKFGQIPYVQQMGKDVSSYNSS